MRMITLKALDEMNPGQEIILLDSLSMEQVLHIARNLPDNSLIFIPNFNVDGEGVPYYNNEAVRLIRNFTNVPIFSFTDTGFGDGSIGGYIVSFNKIGFLAGNIAVKLLNGADPNSILVSENDIYDLIFDERQLSRFGLTDSKLIPKGSTIMFKEVNFLEKYKVFIAISLLFLIIQTILIVNLVRFNRRQRLVTRQLIEAENKFRGLVREDRILRLSQLTASLSHELNQPLTAILSTAQAGIRFIDSDKQDAELMKELFSNIAEDDKRTAAILSSIRGMMKLEIREKERFNLNLLIEEILEIYKSEIVRNRIKLVKILAEPSVCIYADGVQIKQVIMNLITNAIQSIDKSAGNNRQIIVREDVGEGQVTVYVSDTGEGIPDHLFMKIFKPFITSKKTGTGIGLAISRSIIEDHQGRIWAENNAGKGATFAFSLNTC